MNIVKTITDSFTNRQPEKPGKISAWGWINTVLAAITVPLFIAIGKAIDAFVTSFSGSAQDVDDPIVGQILMFLAYLVSFLPVWWQNFKSQDKDGDGTHDWFDRHDDREAPKPE